MTQRKRRAKPIRIQFASDLHLEFERSPDDRIQVSVAPGTTALVLAGPGRLVFALGPDAALDPFELARHVQRSGGALRLTPDMKLVAAIGPRSASATPPRGQAKSHVKTKASATSVLPKATSPAADAAPGRELPEEARRVLSGLASFVRPG